MFEGVSKKLDLAGYFLNNLRLLAKKAGGFAHINVNKKHEVIANLDGFLFEIISAKDFFIQGINEYFHLGIAGKEVSEDELITCRSLPSNAKDVVKKIKGLLSREKTWLWRLNNYRNSATHRELVHFWHVSDGPIIEVREGEEPQFQIILDHETKAPRYLRRIDIPGDVYEFKDLGTYLYKDPEDQSKGRLDIGIIEYCEQSLDKMKKLLENLYAELGI
jgi:hypothetical protein